MMGITSLDVWIGAQPELRVEAPGNSDEVVKRRWITQRLPTEYRFRVGPLQDPFHRYLDPLTRECPGDRRNMLDAARGVARRQ